MALAMLISWSGCSTDSAIQQQHTKHQREENAGECVESCLDARSTLTKIDCGASQPTKSGSAYLPTDASIVVTVEALHE